MVGFTKGETLLQGPLDIAIAHYSRSNIMVSRAAILGLQAAALPSRIKRAPFPVRKFARANRLPFDPLAGGAASRPSVELLISVGPADVDLVGEVVAGAVRCSLNPIVRVALLVDADTALPGLVAGLPVTIHGKETLLSDSTRSTLRATFGDRYGWVLQQFNKLAWSVQSQNAGVLIVDADTVLTIPRGFLDASGCQLLLPTWEYNPPYYRVFDRLGGPIAGINDDELSFISHHMVMQPVLVREMLNDLRVGSVDSLVTRTLESVDIDSNTQSPLCVDYELYGQWLSRSKPERVRFGRWSNLGARRGASQQNSLRSGRFSQLGYASVSFHSYLNLQPD